MKIKDKIADIIIEKRLQGKKIPLWIKWLFPDVVEEVDPIARMLKGDKEPVRRRQSKPVYKLAYATISIIIIMTLALFLWFPSGNHATLQKGGINMEKTETYGADENGVKSNTVRTLITPSTASTSTTATTASETVKERIKGDSVPKDDCGPGKKCITDPVLPPKEDK